MPTFQNVQCPLPPIAIRNPITEMIETLIGMQIRIALG